MGKISVVVVEDESIVSKDIQYSLLNLGYSVVGSFNTGEKLLDFLKKETPDIILMDIMLKGELTGIETANIIKINNDIPIIFLTAYADEKNINNVKNTEPYGYILKPFKEIELKISIEMAFYKNKKQKEREFSFTEKKVEKSVFIKNKGKLKKIDKKDIFYIEALKDYVNIHTEEKKYTILSTMKEMEKKMGKESFLRIHRSYIINVEKIETIKHPNIKLEKIKRNVPIGASYKQKLNNKINQI